MLTWNFGYAYAWKATHGRVESETSTPGKQWCFDRMVSKFQGKHMIEIYTDPRFGGIVGSECFIRYRLGGFFSSEETFAINFFKWCMCGKILVAI